MDSLVIGKKLTRNKNGRFRTAAENVSFDPIIKKVETKLKELIKVRVYLKPDLVTYYAVPTYVFVPKSVAETESFQLRTIPKFLKNK